MTIATPSKGWGRRENLRYGAVERIQEYNHVGLTHASAQQMGAIASI